MRSIIVAVCAALLISSSPAIAWNGRGHMMVASAAWKKLTPPVRARVVELLKLNPDYQTWIAGIPAAKRGEVAFMRASKWADDIKSRAGYTKGDANEPGAAGGRDYADLLQHRYWHFKDIPFSVDGALLEQPYDVNAETQIVAFRKVLGSNKPDAEKSYDLVWLIHLIGDVHQPLHATTRFSKSPDELIFNNLLSAATSGLSFAIITAKAFNIGIGPTLMLLLGFHERVMQLLFGWAEPDINAALHQIREQFAWDLQLYWHWKHILFFVGSIFSILCRGRHISWLLESRNILFDMRPSNRSDHGCTCRLGPGEPGVTFSHANRSVAACRRYCFSDRDSLSGRQVLSPQRQNLRFSV